MKPLKPTSQTTKERQLLSRIREAKFPEDTDRFDEQELRSVTLWGRYKQPLDMSDKNFKLLVLFGTQNHELREERDQLRRRGRTWR